MLFQCWASVEDGGPTLKLHWVNSSCLLGHVAQCWDSVGDGGLISGQLIMSDVTHITALPQRKAVYEYFLNDSHRYHVTHQYSHTLRKNQSRRPSIPGG